MERCFLIIVLIIQAFIAHPQSEEGNKLIEYPLTKPVHNHLDFSILEKICLANKKRFKEYYVELIEKESPLVKVIDSLNTNQLNDLLFINNIKYEINGMVFNCIDTLMCDMSGYNQIETETEDNRIGSSVGWRLKEFENIPINRFVEEVNYSRYLYFNTIVQQDSLVDGDYVMYYDPIYINSSKSFRTNVPYCFFKIRDGKPNGKVSYFTPFGDTLAKGNFLGGVQNGKWEVHLPYYSKKNSIEVNYARTMMNGEFEKQLDTSQFDKGWCTYILEYNKGVLDGDFIFKMDKILRTRGKIKNNFLVGNWNVYHRNGQLANSFTLREAPRLEHKDVIFPEIMTCIIQDMSKAEPYSPMAYIYEALPLGSNPLAILGVTSYFRYKSEHHNVQQNGYKTPLEYNELEILLSNQMLYTKKVEAFYENGQLYFKFKIKNNGYIRSLFPIKVYNKEGEVIQKWILNRKNSKAVIKWMNYLHL